MRLQEWKYTQGTSASGSASKATAQASTATTGFKKRFEKLIKYYKQHTPAEVDYTVINLLTKDTLDFTENYNNWDKVRYTISIDPTTEAWELKIFVNELLTDEYSNKGWAKLLNTLGAYIALPQAGGSEYKELLTEWVVSSSTSSKSISTSSSTATQANNTSTHVIKFKELVDYMKAHGGAQATTVDKLDDTGFIYTEQHIRSGGAKNSGTTYTQTIKVDFGKYKSYWKAEFSMDSKVIHKEEGAGFKELLEFMKVYFPNVPPSHTSEYTNLITESYSSIADDFKTYENLWD